MTTNSHAYSREYYLKHRVLKYRLKLTEEQKREKRKLTARAQWELERIERNRIMSFKEVVGAWHAYLERTHQ